MNYYLFKRKVKGKKKGSEKIVYYAGFLSESPGKKYESIKSTKTGNKNLAQKVAEKMISDSKVLTSQDLLRVYLLDFWDPDKSEYLKSEKIEGREKSIAYIDGNRAIVEKYFLPYFAEQGIKKLSALTRANLLAWRNHLYETGVGHRTINRVRTAVWVALRWAVDMDKLSNHPGQRVRPVKDKPKEKEIFELSELEELFKRPWPDFRCYTACLLAAYTGMRIGEVRGLLVRDLHLEGYLDVLSNYQDGEGIKAPKWGSDRIGVSLPQTLITALAKLLSIHRWGAGSENFVFFSVESPDRPINKHSIGTALRRACKAAGISPRTFHAFRHSFISHASHTLSPAALRDYIGHSNADTTARYLHVTEEDKKALQKVQDRILPFREAK